MNQTNLKQYFPIIRTKEEIKRKIENEDKLKAKFYTWSDAKQEDFLNMCSGNRGVKMLYDAYFKEIMNPEYDPERLSNMLSKVLDMKVRVKCILPNDSTRIGDEMSLIITDIVVELEDKSIANIEVQRIGYKFAGERASCYSADLLLRQYKRLKDSKKEHFSYKDIAPVYTVVFLESSPAIFYEYADQYVHRFRAASDSGLSLNMLQNYVFIPVDIFLKKLHNEGIKDELDGWLTFLGCDEPEYIIRLIEKYPYFKKLYDDLYKMCLNIEGVMNMFSEELQVLDRNTVKYMIDELQEELDDAKIKLDDTKEELDDTKVKLDSTNEQLNVARKTISEKDATIAELQAKLDAIKGANDK